MNKKEYKKLVKDLADKFNVSAYKIEKMLYADMVKQTGNIPDDVIPNQFNQLNKGNRVIGK
jgi:predicted nuclease of restriction endonuclease-like RecB superfamily